MNSNENKPIRNAEEFSKHLQSAIIAFDLSKTKVATAALLEAAGTLPVEGKLPPLHLAASLLQSLWNNKSILKNRLNTLKRLRGTAERGEIEALETMVNFLSEGHDHAMIGGHKLPSSLINESLMIMRLDLRPEKLLRYISKIRKEQEEALTKNKTTMEAVENIMLFLINSYGNKAAIALNTQDKTSRNVLDYLTLEKFPELHSLLKAKGASGNSNSSQPGGFYHESALSSIPIYPI